MRCLLAASGLLLTLTGGVLYLNLGGWEFLTSCFLGMGCVVIGLTTPKGVHNDNR